MLSETDTDNEIYRCDIFAKFRQDNERCVNPYNVYKILKRASFYSHKVVRYL